MLGLDYETEFVHLKTELLPDTMKTSTGKRQYSAEVALHLVIEGKRRLGVGGDVSFDLDKALKTALAEALKKAAHQYGIALELWDEDHRKEIDKANKRAKMTPAQLKQEVWKIGKSRVQKANPTAADVAKVFGVTVADLQEEATLKRILEEEGKL